MCEWMSVCKQVFINWTRTDVVFTASHFQVCVCLYNLYEWVCKFFRLHSIDFLSVSYNSISSVILNSRKRDPLCDKSSEVHFLHLSLQRGNCRIYWTFINQLSPIVSNFVIYGVPLSHFNSTDFFLFSHNHLALISFLNDWVNNDAHIVCAHANERVKIFSFDWKWGGNSVFVTISQLVSPNIHIDVHLPIIQLANWGCSYCTTSISHLLL